MFSCINTFSESDISDLVLMHRDEKAIVGVVWCKLLNKITALCTFLCIMIKWLLVNFIPLECYICCVCGHQESNKL
jgi:hypothetical protein